MQYTRLISAAIRSIVEVSAPCYGRHIKMLIGIATLYIMSPARLHLLLDMKLLFRRLVTYLRVQAARARQLAMQPDTNQRQISCMQVGTYSERTRWRS